MCAHLLPSLLLTTNLKTAEHNVCISPLCPSNYPAILAAIFVSSVWLQPSTTTNGILLAKTSASGLVYALSLVSDGANFLLRLTYQQNANGQTLGTATAEVSLLQAGLTDGAWHSLIVAIGEGVANFYRDGNFVSSR